MNKESKKTVARLRRRLRIRAKISGTSETPRLSVFRSNRDMFLQLIDDRSGKTMASAHSREIKEVPATPGQGRKISVAFELGKMIAAKAAEKKITIAVFDRGGYKYHGRVKAAAEGARAGGLGL